MRIPFFCLLPIVLLISCTKRTEAPEYRQYKDSLEVGMTYEQVEKLLGKPFFVSKGFNEWSSDERQMGELASDEITYVRRVIDSLPDGRCKPWHHITTRGELMYVRWDYEPKIDSVYKFELVYDTTLSQIRTGSTYYVKGSLRKVFLEVDSAAYARYAVGDLYDYGDTMVKIIEKKTVPRFATVVRRQLKGVSRKYIRFLKSHAILFDASTGRLVAQGDYPIETVR
jgi:hypothetical protein